MLDKARDKCMIVKKTTGATQNGNIKPNMSKTPIKFAPQPIKPSITMITPIR